MPFSEKEHEVLEELHESLTRTRNRLRDEVRPEVQRLREIERCAKGLVRTASRGIEHGAVDVVTEWFNALEKAVGGDNVTVDD